MWAGSPDAWRRLCLRRVFSLTRFSRICFEGPGRTDSPSWTFKLELWPDAESRDCNVTTDCSNFWILFLSWLFSWRSSCKHVVIVVTPSFLIFCDWSYLCCCCTRIFRFSNFSLYVSSLSWDTGGPVSTCVASVMFLSTFLSFKGVWNCERIHRLISIMTSTQPDVFYQSS